MLTILKFRTIHHEISISQTIPNKYVKISPVLAGIAFNITVINGIRASSWNLLCQNLYIHRLFSQLGKYQRAFLNS